jgi:hypothetical protein
MMSYAEPRYPVGSVFISSSGEYNYYPLCSFFIIIYFVIIITHVLKDITELQIPRKYFVGVYLIPFSLLLIILSCKTLIGYQIHLK